MGQTVVGTDRAAVRTLLAGAIDYAGLFPPAGLAMKDAVERFAEYQASSDRWALGRFVVPAGRMEECLTEMERLGPAGFDWSLAVTLGPAPEAEAASVAGLNPRMVLLRARVGCFEAKVPRLEAVRRLAQIADGAHWYGEVDLSAPVGPLLDEISRCGGRAKIRMGGVTADAFPPPAEVARFLVEAVHRNLPFKATAGLHHPVRGEYRLTYDPKAPQGTMYGYLNLVAALAGALAGAPVEEIEAALLESDPTAFTFETEMFQWRAVRLDTAAATGLRERFEGFGSCSFREPLDELQPILAR